MAKTPAQLVQERLAQAAQAAASGNAQAAANYAQAAANIKGSGQAKVQAVAAQYAAQAAPAAQQASGGGGGSNTNSTNPAVDQSTINANNAAASASAAQEAYYKEANQQNRDTATSFLKGILTQYNLGSLADQVDSLVTQWGNSTDVIALKLKETQPYKDRFKGLLTLQQRGQTDIQTESQYLAIEADYRAAFRDAGLSNFLGAAGSQSEYDKIATLASDYSVSVAEVKSRIADAQRVVANTPNEVKDALQRYYNVPPSMLVEYALDKTQTQDRINTIANAAVAGGYAAKAGLDLNMSAAEQISGLSQGNDISVDSLTQNMQNARELRDATSRLANIDNTTLTDSEAIQSQMNLDSAAVDKTKKLQSKERARFAGTAGIDGNSLMSNNGF